MKPGVHARGFAAALALVVAGHFAATALSQEAKPRNEAATRQFAAAAALQNREQFDLAADEWSKFLATYANDPRADRAEHYLGICRLKNKQYPEALQAFNKVIADYPKFELLPSTYLHLGLTQYNLALAGQKEMYPKAVETLAALVAKYPQGKEAPQALFYQAEALYAQGQKAEASKLYSQLVQKYPQDPLLPDALYALGVAQEELGQPAAAGTTYDAYLKQFAKQPLANEVTFRRGETLFAQGQFDVAEKWFAAAAGRQGFPLADLALFRQAASFYELRKYPEAAALYAALPQKFPESQYKLPASLAAGKCEYMAGKFAEARKALAQVLAAGGPIAAEAAHWLARSLLKENQPAEALKAVESGLPQAGQGPFAVQLAMDKADCLYDLPERRKESIPLYAALAQQHPQDASAPQALYMAAFASLGAGDHPAALAYADSFLKQYADKDLAPDVAYVAAESDLQLGKYAEANQRYADLLAKYPQRADAEIWKVRRGLALSLAKQPAEAIAALQPVLATLKSKATIAEAHYLIGSSQNALKQYDAAAKSLAAAVQTDPQGRQADEALLALAVAERHTNRMNEAKGRLDQLIQQFPNSPIADQAHYQLGEYAFASGDLKTAAAQYKLVAEKYAASPLAPHAVFGIGWTQLSQQ
ncbi:MAG TPA: tetratricopeptide repeat protein, partial [Pirellulales bacterium]|nr:tetratricopeptide repeat protein [Pirellulales bacterium]